MAIHIVLPFAFAAFSAVSAPVLPPPAPFQPQISDPLLEPMPPAAQQVASWEEALGLLRERSTSLRSAEAGVARAEGRWRQALSVLLPNARLTAGVGFDALNTDVPSVAVSGVPLGVVPGDERRPTAPLAAGVASLSQSLVDVAAWRGLAAAEAGQTGAAAGVQDVRRRLSQGLARGLVSVVAAERAAELNRLGFRQALERAALTQRTMELGAGTPLDVVRVRQDVEVAREALVAGDEQLRRAREALGLALGFDHDVGVSTGFALGGLVEQTRQSCAPLSRVDERPDLEVARAQVDAARESRRQASAGYLPTLGLSSSVSALTTTPAPGKLAAWNISAVLSVPIWEGGFRRGLVSERAAGEEQAAEFLEGTRREVEVEVARARRGVEVADALVKAAGASRALAEETDLLTRRSFEVGRGTSLELVQSAAALRRAELVLALREFELVQARLDSFLTEARCDW